MIRWTLLVLILGSCTVPDEPDIANGRGTVAVSWVAGGAGRVVIACPAAGQPVVVERSK